MQVCLDWIWLHRCLACFVPIWHCLGRHTSTPARDASLKCTVDVLLECNVNDKEGCRYGLQCGFHNCAAYHDLGFYTGITALSNCCEGKFVCTRSVDTTHVSGPVFFNPHRYGQCVHGTFFVRPTCLIATSLISRCYRHENVIHSTVVDGI